MVVGWTIIFHLKRVQILELPRANSTVEKITGTWPEVGGTAIYDFVVQRKRNLSVWILPRGLPKQTEDLPSVAVSCPHCPPSPMGSIRLTGPDQGTVEGRMRTSQGSGRLSVKLPVM